MLILGILLLATLLVTSRCLWRLAGLADLPVSLRGGRGTAKVSIIVPMRNEKRNARACLKALLLQSYSNVELIAVDDCSTDGTMSILKNTVLNSSSSYASNAGEKPSGWIGKSYAAHVGASQASGEWLLFVDADTRAESQLVESLVNQAEVEGLDFISLFPKQELGSFSERLVQPLIFLIFASAFPARQVNDPKNKVAAANGQCIFIRRSTYVEVGGHESVKDSIVEDLSLAQLVKSRGFSLKVFNGRNLIRTRMYTNTLELYEGWRKNLFVGAGLRWRKAFGFVTASLFIGAVAPLSTVLVVLLFSGSASLSQGLVGLLLLWSLIVIKRIQKEYGVPLLYMSVMWLGALISIGIMLSSAILTSLHIPVSWKGRVYDIAALEAHAVGDQANTGALLNPVCKVLRRMSLRYLRVVGRLFQNLSTNQ